MFEWVCFRNGMRFSLNLQLINRRKNMYNIEPLEPHFYIVKLGFTGV